MKKLNNGIRIVVWKLGEAGGYKIIRVTSFGEDLVKELGLGQPFNCAYQEAEDLAVLLDAELVLNGEVIRFSKTAEYYEDKK